MPTLLMQEQSAKRLVDFEADDDQIPCAGQNFSEQGDETYLNVICDNIMLTNWVLDFETVEQRGVKVMAYRVAPRSAHHIPKTSTSKCSSCTSAECN